MDRIIGGCEASMHPLVASAVFNCALQYVSPLTFRFIPSLPLEACEFFFSSFSRGIVNQLLIDKNGDRILYFWSDISSTTNYDYLFVIIP